MSANGQRYNVGGILLERPFKIRRLGHFGFNVEQARESRHFYGDLLGFTVSDKADFSRRAVVSEGCRARRPPWLFHALRHRPPRDGAVLEAGDGPARRPQIRARGDDQPDHLAMRQPEGDRRGAHLFRGTAGAHPARRARHAGQQLAHLCLRPGRPHQRALLRHRAGRLERQLEAARACIIAASRKSPNCRRCRRPPRSPRRKAKGIDIFSGHRPAAPNGGAKYDVDGVLLPRPFKITKIGPVRLFVDDVDRAEAFYTRQLGLDEERGDASIAARAACSCAAAPSTTSLALYPKELRGVLGLSPHTTCMSFGVEVAQLRAAARAVDFLKAQGVTFVDLPPELYPGIDYSAFALDPDGHCIQLYYYMEQIGWDGRVRPAAERRRGQRPMAGGAGAAERYLRRPGVPGPVRLSDVHKEGK